MRYHHSVRPGYQQNMTSLRAPNLAEGFVEALSSKSWRALEFPPGLARPAPNMCGLGIMMASYVVCGTGRLTAGLALLLDFDEARRHANVIHVAKHVLQGLQLANELFALAPNGTAS